MDATEILLARLRTNPTKDDWAQIIEQFRPLLEYWAREPVPGHDTDDIVQDVIARMLEKFHTFRGGGPMGFLAWLKRLNWNRRCDLLRRAKVRRCDGPAEALDDVAAPDELHVMEDAEACAAFVRHVRQIIEVEYGEPAWRSFWERVVSGRPAAEVAAELGIKADDVYHATSRILRRMREEFGIGPL